MQESSDPLSELPDPISTQEAWNAADMEEDSSWMQEWKASEINELVDAARGLPSLPSDPFDADYQSAALPVSTSRLLDVRQQLEVGRGLICIRGIDASQLSTEDSTKIFCLVCSRLGTPLSQSALGERLFHVRDEKLPEGDSRARGPSSNKRLTFHSDRCDVIAFYCLNQAATGGANDVVSSAHLYNLMRETRPDLVRVLMQPFRYKRHNVDGGNKRAFYEQPIFTFEQGRFAAFLMRVLIERAYADPDQVPIRDEQREALDVLAQLAEDEANRISFRQSPGDLVFINNLVTLHRRSEFQDGNDPTSRRHLLRVWLSVPNSRTLSPALAPTFGSVAAGSVRGGMQRAD